MSPRVCRTWHPSPCGVLAVCLHRHVRLFTCHYAIPETSLKLQLPFSAAVPKAPLPPPWVPLARYGVQELGPQVTQPSWGTWGSRAPMLQVRGWVLPLPRAEGAGCRSRERAAAARLLCHPCKRMWEQRHWEKLLTNPFPVRTDQYQAS